MSRGISLCLLVWNEIRGCEQEVPDLPRHLFSEVFALDGGSTDGTIEYLESAGIPVVAQRKRGYNAAYIEALDHFHGDGLIFYHPKGTVSPDSLSSVVEQLNAGVDLVVASRMLPSSINEEDDRLIRHRKWFGLALSRAASLRWNRTRRPRVTDPLHGYRGLSRAFADSLTLEPVGVTADLEMVKHAYVSAATISEVPVHETIRPDGSTHFPAWKTGRKLVAYLIG